MRIRGCDHMHIPSSQARDLAHIVDCLADLFTCSVAGCMGAQVHTHCSNGIHWTNYNHARCRSLRYSMGSKLHARFMRAAGAP